MANSSVGLVSTTVRLKVVREEDVCGVSSARPGGTTGDRVRRIVDGEVVESINDHPWQVRALTENKPAIRLTENKPAI